MVDDFGAVLAVVSDVALIVLFGGVAGPSEEGLESVVVVFPEADDASDVNEDVEVDTPLADAGADAVPWAMELGAADVCIEVVWEEDTVGIVHSAVGDEAYPQGVHLPETEV